MSTKTKSVEVRRFRVKVGDRYCSLSTAFHELGVCIPDAPDMSSAFVFRTLQGANNAIGRTQDARDAVKRSLTPDFKGFAPLKFDGEPVVEEFLTNEAEGA